MPVLSDGFKRALGSWPSGVAIVTTRAGDEIQGMTVSAFSSVSLDPPLVLICADKTSNTHALLQRSGCFAVNILAADQADLALHFADKTREATRFQGLSCGRGVTGAPLIPGVVASIDCVTLDNVDAGDHVIHVGRADHVATYDRPPLLYLRSGFGAFARHRERPQREDQCSSPTA